MSEIYRKLEVTPVINARGTHTRLGGSIMDAEVVDAMRQAAGSYVLLEELQREASHRIAQATGAEAGLVTGGAAASMLIGTAACIAGDDPAKIEQLPDTTGLKHQVVVHRAHRNGYDHSVRAAGAKLVEVGYGHRTIPYQVESAFNECTAMVLYVVSPWVSRGALTLSQTCEIAHRFDVPVLVDAAAALPPASNLTRFISDGADLVTFSGGKGIRGPQSSGILAGRADLIRAAWLNGSPNHSIGRPGKAAKEDIVGLLVALERYLERDHDADIARWQTQAELVAGVLGALPGVTTTVLHDWREHPTPRVEVLFDPSTGIDAHALVLDLEEGDPRLYVFEPDGPSSRPNSIVVLCSTLQAGEETTVAQVMATAIGARIAVPVTSAIAAS